MEVKKKILFLVFIFFVNALFLASVQMLAFASNNSEEKIPLKFLDPQTKEEQNSAYQIDKGDVLLVTVWGNEDLKTETIVGPDGLISFPLIGDVKAQGVALAQLDQEITERLKIYIRQPEVSLVIKEFAGKRTSILGEIAYPGIYKLNSQDRILELVALAGGFTPDAVLKRVIIIRKRPQPVIILVNLNKAILNADPSQNIVLEPDDIVYISKKLVANIKYFWDQVIGPPANQVLNIQDMTAGRWKP